jgi:hypothetical protein
MWQPQDPPPIVNDCTVNTSGMVDAEDKVDLDEEDKLHSIVLCYSCQRKMKMVVVP